MLSMRKSQVEIGFRKTHSSSWYEKKPGTESSDDLIGIMALPTLWPKTQGQPLCFRKRKSGNQTDNLASGLLYKVTTSLLTFCGLSSQSSSENLVEDAMHRAGCCQC